MIFVTVGTTEYPFDRLLREMDRIAPDLGEEVMMQTGCSEGTFPNTVHEGFMKEEDIVRCYDTASLIVCHSGVGTILNGLERNIPLVVVPRTVRYHEVDTDHQFMIADKVVRMGRGICVTEIGELKDAIERARSLEFPPYVHDRSLCDFVSGLLSEIEMSKGKGR